MNQTNQNLPIMSSFQFSLPLINSRFKTTKDSPPTQIKQYITRNLMHPNIMNNELIERGNRIGPQFEDFEIQ